MGLTLQSRATLNDGSSMPIVGLGVWRARAGHETVQAVRTALQTGYRMVDTAKLYANEAEVGRAVRECGISRRELFVTTKLWNSDHGRARAARAFAASLAELGLEYVDLYLVHWPGNEFRLETWQALQELRASGRCRSIGVSNFRIDDLQELLERAEIVPAVNQIELHPHAYPRELVGFCERHRIQVEAYSPLGRGRSVEEPAIREIAARHGRTAAQVALRWGVQHGWIVIPKSVHPSRIRENATIFDFELSPPEMQRIDDLTVVA